MMRSSVVLPQPEGPISDTNSPGCTLRFTSDSARTSPSRVPKVSETRSASIAAMHDFPQAAWRERDLGDLDAARRQVERVLDRLREERADRDRAAFTRPLGAERVERGGRLGVQHLHP